MLQTNVEVSHIEHDGDGIEATLHIYAKVYGHKFQHESPIFHQASSTKRKCCNVKINVNTYSTIISDTLSWNSNNRKLIQRANNWILLLKNFFSCGTSSTDMAPLLKIICCFILYKGELLFSSVEQVKLIHVHWLCSSSQIHQILAQ